MLTFITIAAICIASAALTYVVAGMLDARDRKAGRLMPAGGSKKPDPALRVIAFFVLFS